MISRGDICWADLGPIVDHAPAKRRPVVVVQNDIFTHTSIGTILVVAMSSKLGRARLRGTVFVPKSISGLPHNSMIVPTEIITADRSRIEQPVARLPRPLLDELDAGLRLVLNV
ncbi:type II toxin-antitoxin system PemK/MazF family toxin [Microcella alkaliphila]|uniref:mRNA interferase n=1 Tax=Microcella alkaliphila TaxID=279828 RepID=A0A0U5CGD4_9MICO|nr:type II toxin-antitoxin system PemK/MazF family toxin [Microcella alkaliphila]BAU32594.1 mRNA interferase [Microcella alkaliphila]